MLTRSLTVLALALAATGCNKDIALGLDTDGSAVTCTPLGCTQSTDVRLSRSPQNKVDVLFMIDDTSDMAALQAELMKRFGDFMAVFETAATQSTYVDLHVGVVTSDYGAGDVAAGNCQASPGGGLGVMKAIGTAADPSCALPTDGAPFLAFAFAPGGATSNLPGGNTVGALSTAFTCMASVGTAGCQFTSSLESVYAALHDTSHNAGFLRDDAILAVVYVTQRDDGSAPPNAQLYEDTPALDATNPYSVYRQTEAAITCGDPPTALPTMSGSNGPLVDCQASKNPGGDPGAAFDIARYVSFFTKPNVEGGVKPDPNDVMLFAIDGPDSPFETLLATVGTGEGTPPDPAYLPCSPYAEGSCEPRLQHACQNEVTPAFFGDPALRLNTVVRSTVFHDVESACGADVMQAPSFSLALGNMAQAIVDNIGAGCIDGSLPDPLHPDCVVTQVTPQADGTQELVAIPQCLIEGGPTPCWKVDAKMQCTQASPQSLGLDVLYSEDTGVPPGAYLNAVCATLVS